MVRGDRQLPQPYVQRERPSGQLRTRVLLRYRRHVGQGLRLHHTHGRGRPAVLYGRQALPDVDRHEGPPPAGIPGPQGRERLPCRLAAASAFVRREGCLRQARLGKRQSTTEPGAEEIHGRALPQAPTVHAGRGRHDRRPRRSAARQRRAGQHLHSLHLGQRLPPGPAQAGGRKMDALRRRHPGTAHRTRSRRARRRDPASHGAQQRPRADLRRPCRGRAAVLCGRALAEAAAHGRPHAPARLAPALRYRVRRGAQRRATPALYHREHGGAAAYGRPAAWQLAADVGRERPIERGVGQAVAQGSPYEQLPIRRLQDRRTRAVRLEERPSRTEQHLRNRSARDHAATRNATRCAQAVLR